MARVDFTGAKLYVNPLASGNNKAGYQSRFGIGSSSSITTSFEAGTSLIQSVSGTSNVSNDTNSVRIVCSGIVPTNATDFNRIYLGTSANYEYCGYYIYIPNGFAGNDTFAFEMTLTAPLEPGQSGTT